MLELRSRFGLAKLRLRPVLLMLAVLFGCGQGDVGEAKLTWSAVAGDSAANSRTIRTWALLAETGSRHGAAGRLLHIHVPLPSRTGAEAVDGRLQLDLPLGRAAADLEGRYTETRGDAIVFDGRLVAGAMVVTAEADGPCDCRGGAFSLVFVDAGPDGERGTDDDDERRLSDGSYVLEGGGCAQLSAPGATDGADRVTFRVDADCGAGQAAGFGGPAPPRQAPQSVPASGPQRAQPAPRDRGRSGGSTTLVVLSTAPPPPPPPAATTRTAGCSGDGTGGGCAGDGDGGGCAGDDSGDGGGCAGDDSGDSGGCAGDDSGDSGGCAGDDSGDSGGCAGDDGDSGCEGDRSAAMRGERPTMCRRRGGLPSGVESSLWMALALLWTGRRDRHTGA